MDKEKPRDANTRDANIPEDRGKTTEGGGEENADNDIFPHRVSESELEGAFDNPSSHPDHGDEGEEGSVYGTIFSVVHEKGEFGEGDDGPEGPRENSIRIPRVRITFTLSPEIVKRLDERKEEIFENLKVEEVSRVSRSIIAEAAMRQGIDRITEGDILMLLDAMK